MRDVGGINSKEPLVDFQLMSVAMGKEASWMLAGNICKHVTVKGKSLDSADVAKT